MTKRETEIITLLKEEVKPALGCTEPIAVALSVAKALEIIAEKCEICSLHFSIWRMQVDFRIDIEVSGNILKNGMGVGIPGTGMVGLYIAAALGAVCGKSKYGLEVLHDLSDEAISRAKELVNKKLINIKVAKTDEKLYVKSYVSVGEECKGSSEFKKKDLIKMSHNAYAVIKDNHDKIVETAFDNILIETCGDTNSNTAGSKTIIDYGLTVKEILEFTNNVNIEDILFILEQRRLNLNLANEGLSGNYGLSVGKTIRDNQIGVFGSELMSYAMGMTAAASDARMAGCTLPAMSNSGSGNQGITVSMPVISYAMTNNISDNDLARALILSNLIAIHIKGYLGKLSALCGCVVASSGAACGIVYLKGGGYEQVCAAIKNMVGNIMGMLCDGAKVGCAMKVSSGVSSAIQSAMLAINGKCIAATDGIIDENIEKTIQNLGKIGSQGMLSADAMILDIMSCK